MSDEALECVEELVLSFLTRLSDAMPDAYSHLESKKGPGRKVSLQVADRSKQYVDGYVSAVR